MELVEVHILEKILLLPSYKETTIQDLSDAAIAEYKKSFPCDRPRKAVYVQDSQGRIIIGSLLVLGTGLEKEFEVVFEDMDDNDNNPISLIDHFKEWVKHSALQIQKYINVLCDPKENNQPSTDIFEVITFLKYSENVNIIKIIISSLHTLIKHFKQHPISNYAINELLIMFQLSTSPLLALDILKSIKYAYCFCEVEINIQQLAQDIEGALVKFESHQGDILQIFDSLKIEFKNGTNSSNQILQKTNEPFSDDIAFTSTVTSNSTLTTQQTFSSTTSSKETILPFQSSFSNISKDQQTLISNTKDNRRHGPTTTIDPLLQQPKPTISSTGIHPDRLLALLLSPDIRCRQFALRKLTESFSTSQDSNNNNNNNNNNGSSRSSNSNSSLVPIDLIPQLVNNLLLCLKLSIKAPNKLSRLKSNINRTTNVTVDDSSSSSSSTSSSTNNYPTIKTRAHEECLSRRIIQLALASSDTDLPSIHLILTHLIQLCSLSPPCGVMIRPFFNLLLTLCHAIDPYLSETSATLLLFAPDPNLIDFLWDDRLTLEISIIYEFLHISNSTKKQQLVLYYLLYLSRNINSNKNNRLPSKDSDTNPPNSRTFTHTPNNNDNNNMTVLHSIIKYNNFYIFDKIIIFIFSENALLSVISLEIFATLIIESEFKKYLSKFSNFIDKVLQFLTELLLNYYSSYHKKIASKVFDESDRDDHTENSINSIQRKVQFLLKALINLLPDPLRIQKLLNTVVESSVNLRNVLEIFASEDDVVAFYFKLLQQEL